MFTDRPWFGWGGGSFSTELARYLPGIQAYSAEDLRILGTTGGAHNAYLTALAERGVVGGVAAILVTGFLLWLSIRLFGARHRVRGVDRVVARLAPFVVLLILVRAFGELPGWFGYADSLVDFFAYGCAAMIVAVAASIERAQATESPLVGAPVGARGSLPVPPVAPTDSPAVAST
jgi:O-antigen ligase